MSGAFIAPHSLTGGAGYKANPTYDPILRKHSAFYRRHSAASAALETDRRLSSANPDDLASQVAEAQQNIKNGEGHAEASASPAGDVRRGSIMNAAGGSATANERSGSVFVGSSAGRRESVFGMESTRGHIGIAGDGAGGGQQGDMERRGSTSLASDLLGKWKARRRSSVANTAAPAAAPTAPADTTVAAAPAAGPAPTSTV